MDSLGLSDKQRQIVIRFKEKRDKRHHITDRVEKAQSTTSVSVDRRLLDFEDKAPEAPKSSKVDTQRLMAQMAELEAEMSQLSESLLTSVGITDADLARSRIRELDAKFDHCLAHDDNDEFYDRASASKRVRADGEIPLNPEIPRLSASENIDSVRSKVSAMKVLREKSEEVLRRFEAEKTACLGGDEVDPLDAYMASASMELVDEQVAKETEKLAEISKFLAKFEQLELVLSKHQFSDVNIQAAIQQKETVRTPLPVFPLSAVQERGKGTVWEDEFRKDESVPQRLERRPMVPTKTSKLTVLNAAVGGLQVMDGSVVPVADPAWAPPDESGQEKLRKKLGY